MELNIVLHDIIYRLNKIPKDFNSLMAILIKEKEIYKIKILASPFNDFVISQLMSLNNLEIEVIEKI